MAILVVCVCESTANMLSVVCVFVLVNCDGDLSCVCVSTAIVVSVVCVSTRIVVLVVCVSAEIVILVVCVCLSTVMVVSVVFACMCQLPSWCQLCVSTGSVVLVVCVSTGIVVLVVCEFVNFDGGLSRVCVSVNCHSCFSCVCQLGLWYQLCVCELR